MSESPRIASEMFGQILDSTVSCENCATPVSVIQVSREGQPQKPELLELSENPSQPFLIDLEPHTPERCRAARRERP